MSCAPEEGTGPWSGRNVIWNPGYDDANGEVINIRFESVGPPYTKSEK